VQDAQALLRRAGRVVLQGWDAREWVHQTRAEARPAARGEHRRRPRRRHRSPQGSGARPPLSAARAGARRGRDARSRPNGRGTPTPHTGRAHGPLVSCPTTPLRRDGGRSPADQRPPVDTAPAPRPRPRWRRATSRACSPPAAAPSRGTRASTKPRSTRRTASERSAARMPRQRPPCSCPTPRWPAKSAVGTHAMQRTPALAHIAQRHAVHRGTAPCAWFRRQPHGLIIGACSATDQRGRRVRCRGRNAITLASHPKDVVRRGGRQGAQVCVLHGGRAVCPCRAQNRARSHVQAALGEGRDKVARASAEAERAHRAVGHRAQTCERLRTQQVRQAACWVSARARGGRGRLRACWRCQSQRSRPSAPRWRSAPRRRRPTGPRRAAGARSRRLRLPAARTRRTRTRGSRRRAVRSACSRARPAACRTARTDPATGRQRALGPDMSRKSEVCSCVRACMRACAHRAGELVVNVEERRRVGDHAHADGRAEPRGLEQRADPARARAHQREVNLGATSATAAVRHQLQLLRYGADDGGPAEVPGTAAERRAAVADVEV
jgi:hypothetical protein